MNDQMLEIEKKIRDKANQEKGMFTYKLCYIKTRSHLGCTLQKLCYILTCALNFYKQFYIKVLSAYIDWLACHCFLPSIIGCLLLFILL